MSGAGRAREAAQRCQQPIWYGGGGTTGRMNPRMGGQWGEPEGTSQPDDPGGVGGYNI